MSVMNKYNFIKKCLATVYKVNVPNPIEENTSFLFRVTYNIIYYAKRAEQTFVLYHI